MKTKIYVGLKMSREEYRAICFAINYLLEAYPEMGYGEQQEISEYVNILDNSNSDMPYMA